MSRHNAVEATKRDRKLGEVKEGGTEGGTEGGGGRPTAHP